VFIGDSITEHWRGTANGYGIIQPEMQGIPEVLHETIAVTWPAPLVLGITGDMTQNVLWRLDHGELSAPAMLRDPGLLFVLLIGTNNLGNGHSPEEAHAGIVAVARQILQRSAGRLLVNALLPRGDWIQLQMLCPSPAFQKHYGIRRCNRSGLPFTSFLPAVGRVNDLLARTTAELAVQFPGRVQFVNCSAPFEVVGAADASAGEEQVPVNIMPDHVHPNAQGHRYWARCIIPALQRLESLPGVQYETG
jgi:lysophospholipase L1-like esterase